MLFPSPVFLFAFLPAVLLAHAAVPERCRNAVLLAASLLFYAWGEPALFPVMLLSILGNWLAGLWLGATRRPRLVLGLAVAANLGLLGVFKYADFVIGAVDEFGAGLVPFALPLPLGISFFTFHAVSYLVDVQRGTNKPQLGLGHFALYMSFFPQLIAGPIIRYHDVADQLARRTIPASLFASGVERFILGFAQKVLLANPLGAVVDQAFGLPDGELGAAAAWAGLLAYTGQVFFDFSGYSSMAIGLGRMAGFRFLENFNYPYAARSIQEFWRRWHISLSNWFRDYLYVPLGGNRNGRARTYANLALVFALCGLWHGANWTFLVWGLLHGSFLILERAGFAAVLQRWPVPVRHLYVLLVVMLAWVFFRAGTLAQAGAYLAALGGADGWRWATAQPWLDNQVLLVAACGMVGSTPLLARAAGDWRMRLAQVSGHGTALGPVFEPGEPGLLRWARLIALPVLFLLSLSAVASGTYNPFLYFRF